MNKHVNNVSIVICKHHTKGQRVCPAEKWEIDNLKVEIVPFIIDFRVKSSICVNIEEKIKV